MRRHQGGEEQFGDKAPLAVVASLAAKKSERHHPPINSKGAAPLLPSVRYFGFVSPALFLISLLTLLPVLYVVYLSLRDFNLMSFTDEYIGLGNFYAALSDPEIGHVITNTVTYVGLSLGLETVLGFCFALLCFVVIPPWSVILRGVILFPLLLMPISVGVLWKNVLFNPPYEMLSRLVKIPDDVLANPQTALFGIILATVWAYTPAVFIMMSAALSGVATELIEAARIDGATFIQVVSRILIPTLRPILVLVLNFAGVELFIEFAIPWIMTGGGPGGASYVLTTFIYSRAFAQQDYGYGACLALLMLLLALLLSSWLIYHVWSGAHEESFT
jgi:ABC-type sugar transport system permease subunit